MKLTAKPMIYHFHAKDVVAVFLSEEYEKDIDSIIPELGFIKERADLSSFRGRPSELMFIPFRSFPNIIIIGMGKKKKVTKESVRNNSSEIVKLCRKRNIPCVHVVLPVIKELEELEVISSIAEGLALSDYAFDKYKSNNEEDDRLLARMDEASLYCARTEEAAKILRDIEIIGENTNLCRDMVNETSEAANPGTIAKAARALTRIKGVACRVYDKKELEDMKMGLLLAVGRGSVYGPRLVVLKYGGNPRSKKKTVIVGKGITFDSGGMDLKTSSGMEDMRSDMAGAAVCLFAVRAAAMLKLKKNIIAVIPLCENMISNNSFRPGDVFKAYNSRNVEIGNTDAEGRLILADAVAFAEKVLKPDYIIDIATLTGACLVCLGEVIAAVISDNDSLANSIFNAGEETGDRVWRLPLAEDYEELIKSDIADIKNTGQRRIASTIVGATFIKKFIRDIPWAHIDIAGTSWYSKARGYRPKYATGFGVRLFIELFKTMDG